RERFAWKNDGLGRDRGLGCFAVRGSLFYPIKSSLRSEAARNAGVAIAAAVAPAAIAVVAVSAAPVAVTPVPAPLAVAAPGVFPRQPGSLGRIRRRNWSGFTPRRSCRPIDLKSILVLGLATRRFIGGLYGRIDRLGAVRLNTRRLGGFLPLTWAPATAAA